MPATTAYPNLSFPARYAPAPDAPESAVYRKLDDAKPLIRVLPQNLAAPQFRLVSDLEAAEQLRWDTTDAYVDSFNSGRTAMAEGQRATAEARMPGAGDGMSLTSARDADMRAYVDKVRKAIAATVAKKDEERAGKTAETAVNDLLGCQKAISLARVERALPALSAEISPADQARLTLLRQQMVAMSRESLDALEESYEALLGAGDVARLRDFEIAAAGFLLDVVRQPPHEAAFEVALGGTKERRVNVAGNRVKAAARLLERFQLEQRRREPEDIELAADILARVLQPCFRLVLGVAAYDLSPTEFQRVMDGHRRLANEEVLPQWWTRSLPDQAPDGWTPLGRYDAALRSRTRSTGGAVQNDAFSGKVRRR